MSLDQIVLAVLAPLSGAILISGLDDLLVDSAWALLWIKSKYRPAARMFPPGPRQLDTAPSKRIAILVPLWHEHAVIARMLEHNLAAIRYPDYHIFAGCYPNDGRTQEAVRSVAARFPQVHLAVCPHDGPTSKADCMNWIYQHLLLHEEQTGKAFEIVSIHDAEDIVHPEELRWINYYAARYDFVQTPVLPLPTPLRAVTHGVYCDEFAENHSRDMIVRAAFGGFVPSCGVGTGYRRDALERLAEACSNRIFEPAALTEDYENGLQLHRLGCSQAFVPILRDPKSGEFMATREFFPATWGAALRQRTRWVTGIALQSWERLGWSGTPGEVYWLWRDRKGLIGNPLSLLANFVFVYGIATSMWTRTSPAALRLAAVTLALQLIRTAVRMGCVARIYGFVFALGVPVRAVYANALNSAATFGALARYTSARVRGVPLKWLKTEHAYPNRATLLGNKRKLGEILVGSGRLPEQALATALTECKPGVRLGEFLVESGRLDAESLYKALSFQQGLPLAEVEASAIPWSVARCLPEQVMKKWLVLPFRVADGNLFVASPEAPTSEATAALETFTGLEIRFHLVTPSKFEELTEALHSTGR
jgi:adsorption protein B